MGDLIPLALLGSPASDAEAHGTGAVSREHPRPGRVQVGSRRSLGGRQRGDWALGVACRGSRLCGSPQGRGIPQWGFWPQRGAREKPHTHLLPVERQLWEDGPVVRPARNTCRASLTAGSKVSRWGGPGGPAGAG